MTLKKITIDDEKYLKYKQKYLLIVK
jgi:hypothetical protein